MRYVMMETEEEEKFSCDKFERCKNCKEFCDPYDKPALRCNVCSKTIHLECLERKSVPVSFIGDVFFELNCSDCSPFCEETLTRKKMSWLNVIVLTLYNLRIKSSGISKNGYFHWKSDISTFVDRNWDYLFKKAVKRKKNWIGTVSGTLSHYSGIFFQSGTFELGESGWWKLMTNDPPELLIAKNERMMLDRKKQITTEIKVNKVYDNPNPSESRILVDTETGCSKEIARSQEAMSLCWQDCSVSSDALSDFSVARDELNENKVGQMTVQEELYLLLKIHKSEIALAPPTIKRLYRKLYTRKMKRERGLSLLDIDKFQSKTEICGMLINNDNNRVLDRFFGNEYNCLFEQRLEGYNKPTSVHSPYTNRLLKPFIRRDTIIRPLWLRLMEELDAKVNGSNKNWRPSAMAPIDYSYIRPQHIPAINSLCNQFFWPGVDLTECLQYPDFSCVVLYKKLVVGFAILVPDVGYNEAYVSFFFTRPEWRKSGIGTFMLYHLIQTCMGKDVTLHVSATNPALILYQKFGFKVEEFVQEFYDKYLPPYSRECKHALFLRLSR